MRPTLEAQPAVDLTHPLGVAAGQVVVRRDEVHAPATEAVEVGRQGRHEGLALAGLHLGDPPEVEGGAAHELHVVVALADDPAGRLADDRERLDQQVVEILAVGEPLAELGRLGPQRVVGQRLHLGFERVDVGHQRAAAPSASCLRRREGACRGHPWPDDPTGEVAAGGPGAPPNWAAVPAPATLAPWRGSRQRSSTWAAWSWRREARGSSSRSTREPISRR